MLCIFLLGCLPALAQKELKVVRTSVKAGKSAEALKEIQRLCGDSTWRDNPGVYALAYQAHRLNYNAQNEKMYLRQKADTMAYFKAIQGMFHSAQKCDSIERVLWQRNRKKPRHHMAHTAELYDLMPNLNSSVAYFYSHSCYDEAADVADRVLNLSADSVFWGKNSRPDQTTLQRQLAALVYVRSCYQMKRYESMFRRDGAALEYEPTRAEVREELAVARLQMGDSLAYRDSLRRAIAFHPTRPSFYNRLRSCYLRHSEYDKILKLARFVLQSDSSRIDCRHDEIVSLYLLKEYEQVHKPASALIAIAPDDAIANYYLAMVYVHAAREVPVPIKRTNKNYRRLVAERNKLYAKARPPMEIYRKAKPDAVKFWGQPLYDIYLNLNLGKEFEEVSRIMSSEKP